MQRCTTSFEHDGVVYEARRTRVADDHEVLRSHPDYFAPVASGPGVGQRSEQRTRSADGKTTLSERQLGEAAARQEMRSRIEAAADDPANLEKPEAPRRTARPPKDNTPGAAQRESALRMLETRAADLEPVAGDRLERLIRSDRSGLDSDYISAVGHADYEGAFWKRLADPASAALVMTAGESEATRRVARATEARSMAEGEGATGGFGVPLSLDPTIAITSSVSPEVPMRELATVTTIATGEWKGVSSAGVTAAFGPEATEAADGAPTLAQPAIKAEKYSCFVPFSIEVGMDYGGLGLQAELAGLLADARGVVEADRFTFGTASNHEPEGFLVGGTVTVSTAGTAAFAAADVYTAQEALGARYQSNASWVSSLGIANDVWRFVPTGSTTNAPLFNDSRTEILGRPWHQFSTMGSSLASGSKLLAYGDWSRAYRIVDRIGMTVELIPHLFGSSRRPTGQRGLYAYGRVGGGVINPNALRVLKAL
jgi:HK97 family phage major capsid protein